MPGRIIDTSSPCVEWTGCQNAYGYGVARRKGKTQGVHRWAWIDAYGPIPEGMHVHHACHNKLCVNLDHLELKDPSTHKREHIAEDGLSGMAAVHAAKMTCDKGHPFEVRDGRRMCRECRRETAREWARRQAATPEGRARQNENARRYRERQKAS